MTKFNCRVANWASTVSLRFEIDQNKMLANNCTNKYKVFRVLYNADFSFSKDKKIYFTKTTQRIVRSVKSLLQKIN